ncbi:MAG TPA: RNA polymerase sigma factor [Planctomycetota bacterium]
MDDAARERLQQRILNVAFLMLGDREAAEDVAQETLLRTVERHAQFRGDGSLFAWACSIAINLCRARRLADRKAPRAVDPARLDGKSPAHGPVSNAIILETHQRAASAVRGLSPILREAFVLRFIEDLPFQDIAEITGVSEGAARLRARRARLSLQSHLADLLEPAVRGRLDVQPTPARP